MSVPGSPSPAVPLVLLPGMNCSAGMWGPAGAGAVHAELDRTGIDAQVDALLDVLPDRFALAGLSLGGIVAMALTRRAPERVAGLCLLATNAGPPTDGQRAAWAAQLTRLDDGATARELQLLDLLLADRTLDDRALQMADEVGERALAAQLRLQGTRIDERPGLRSVAVPTLVLAGERDRLCPVERHTEIASLVPGADLHVVPGAGHLLPMEEPDTVAGLMGGWLDEVRAQAGAGAH
ncbi:hypothetical protein AD006_22095 [Pseudonocardia sp. EC080610-09]|nr:hypothetical protein AD006_22095 [Pseudonocardia sp. EC080610-09]ALL84171.1 hypothetical protein AD017_01680 [Pseudonocardia sp. EC080619-01]